MPSINTEIWLALKSGIEAIPFSPAWPIAWPGSVYSPQAGVQFIAVGKVQAAPQRALINRPVMDRAGTLTVTPVMTIGQETAVYEEWAGIIADHFTGRQLRYGGVCLTLQSQGGNAAYVSDGFRDGGWWRAPVVIPWRTWR